MPNASNVLAGKPKVTGGIRYTRNATAFPDDATTALTAEWLDAGYVSSDGLVQTIDASDDKIVAWGGDIVKVVRTEHSVSYTFTLIETRSADALKLMFGEENVTVTDGLISVDLVAGMVPRASFVFDMKDEKGVRVVVEDGQPAISGDVNFVDEDVIGYEVTVEAFPNDKGVKATLMVEGDGTDNPEL
jgi:hypothetical protein